MHVHHLKYHKEPWDAKNEDLMCICEFHHKLLSQEGAYTIEQLKEMDKDDIVSRLNWRVYEEIIEIEGIKDNMELKVKIQQTMTDIFIRFRVKLWEDKGYKRKKQDK